MNTHHFSRITRSWGGGGVLMGDCPTTWSGVSILAAVWGANFGWSGELYMYGGGPNNYGSHNNYWYGGTSLQ